MGETREIDGLSGSQLLDHVEALAATQHRCEVEILRAAVQHAYLHDRATVDPVRAGRPGRERARRVGGSGTPEVAEFAAAELGALSTTHHRLKTFGHWTLRQPFPGIYLWRDPHGAHYLVDHTGTRRLHRDHAA